KVTALWKALRALKWHDECSRGHRGAFLHNQKGSRWSAHHLWWHSTHTPTPTHTPTHTHTPGVQICESARPLQQTAPPHSHQSDSACSAPPPHRKGPIGTCLAPDIIRTQEV